MKVLQFNQNAGEGVVMIEEALVGSNFLIPARRPEKTSGYIDRKTYAEAIKQAWFIGCYDERGQFRVNRALMFQYHSLIPEIADSLTADTRSPEHQKYKLAALQKGSLELFLEWRVATTLKAHNLDLRAGRLFRDSVGLPTLLVDMGGPSYEVVAPDSVNAFMKSFDIETADYSHVG